MDLETLKRRVKRGEKFRYLYFWGHRQKGHQTDKSCLSQWFEASFVKGEHTFATAEHWMMAEKARLFGDEEALKKILAAHDPGKVKALGRKVRGFDEARWAQARFEIVREGNLAKFSQNPHLKAFLIGTGKRVLVEASPHDRIWGVGLSAKDQAIASPTTWRGQNLLGFALMAVRTELVGASS